MLWVLLPRKVAATVLELPSKTSGCRHNAAENKTDHTCGETLNFQAMSSVYVSPVWDISTRSLRIPPSWFASRETWPSSSRKRDLEVAT